MAPPVKKRILYVDMVAQHAPLKKDLLAAVERVLDSGQFILGPEVEQFEKRFARLVGPRFALGVANGTDALTLALRAAGVGPGDEVITAANSFVASANCAALLGARPVLVDCRDDLNIDPTRIEKAITPKTKALIPVHLTGRPAAMDEITAIAKKHGLAVVEDAAQAVFAEYKGRAVGSFGFAGCFSLHPLKTLNACGDGGVITVDDEKVYERLKRLRNLGLESRENCLEFGPNSRLDTIQAAMLLVKLDRVHGWTDARRRNAAFYQKALAGIPGLDCPKDLPHEKAVYHTFVIQCDRRDQLKSFLAERGVDTAVHYPIPIHLQTAGKALAYPKGSFPVAERQAGRILSLPVYPELTQADLNRVAELIREFYKA